MKSKILYSILFNKIGGLILYVLWPVFCVAKKKNKWKKYRSYYFLWAYKKENLKSKSVLKNSEFVVVDTGKYNYNYFNIAFLHNMLSSAIAVLEEGKFPIIQLKNRKKDWINWDSFFEQTFPLKSDVKNLSSFLHDVGAIEPWFTTPFNRYELQLWTKVYHDFVIFNKETKKYVDNEYKAIIEPHKRVLGVLCRGTDYVKLEPKGHPIQPTVEQVIAEVKVEILKLNINKIYLATEEKRITARFEEEFPGQILVNKRKYYDDLFYGNNFDLIGSVSFEREDDDKLKGLEYLSSIFLLSKCTALIAGNTGGSCAALYMNNHQYEYWKLYQLGYYGVD